MKSPSACSSSIHEVALITRYTKGQLEVCGLSSAHGQLAKACRALICQQSGLSTCTSFAKAQIILVQ